MAEAVKIPKPHSVRLLMKYMQWDLVPEIQAHPELAGKCRRHSLANVLLRVLEHMDKKTHFFVEKVKEIADACSLKPRTVGKKLKVLELAGYIERFNNGAAPWGMQVHTEKIHATLLGHRARRTEDRSGVAKSGGMTPSASKVADSPPTEPHRQQVPQSTAQRKPPKPVGRGSRILATLLWNVSPWRRDGSQELTAEQKWPDYVLELNPRDLARLMDLYFAACALGSPRWGEKTVSPEDFLKRFWDVKQWDEAPRGTMQPSLGRALRPEWERQRYERDGVQWRAEPQPSRGPNHPRARLLEPWLRQFYDRDTFPDKLGEVLEQDTGPPPDWLPEELKPNWGQLRVFTVPH